MRDVLPTLGGWARAGTRAALATVVGVERSAPRMPGSVMAVSATGQVVGSVTGGCVEGAVYEHAREVLDGGPPRVATFGVADDEAFEVGLPCGGTVHVMIEPMDPELVLGVAAAVADERPVAYVTTLAGPGLGDRRLVTPDTPLGDAVDEEARALLAAGDTGTVAVGEDEVFVSAIVPRPQMYVFGAIDFASALATLGHLLGYRVTVCDPRSIFVTRERFPDADELVTEWPHEFLARAPVDGRTAICVLTHDAKFDVPALKEALATPAGYIGAMGSSRTTARRRERLLAEGVADEELARVHAPIGLKIGSQTPEEVAVAIAAQIIAVARQDALARKEAREARAHV